MVRRYSSVIVSLLLLFQFSFAAKLAVKLTPQEMDQWCWAATSECAIEYHGMEITQSEIVKHVKGSVKNEPGQPDEMVKALNMGNLNAEADQNVSSWTEQDFRDEADGFHPATMGYNRQHVISYVGYTGEIGSAVYHMMDPWPVDQGEWKDYSFATLKNNEIGPLDLVVTTNGTPPVSDTIKVTAPDAGDEWMQGSEQQITWEDNFDGDVKIELIKGSNTTTISASTASSGSFDWTVPDDQAVGSGYTVVITSVDNASVTDESGSFSVTEADQTEYVLTVNSGAGDGNYVKGTKVSISADDAPADTLMFDKWTGSGASACDDIHSSTTKLTMPGNDCEVTATYKEKPPTSDNLVIINDWEEQVDAQSSMTVDSSKVDSDTVVTFDFTLGTQPSDTEYVWTQVYHYLDTAKSAFKNVSAIELTYKSDDDLEIILSQEGLSEGGANYTHTLEASSDWKSTIVAISMDNFSQPSWVSGDLKKDLDIAKCNGIGFSPKIDQGASSTAAFKVVCLIGYVPPVSIVDAMLPGQWEMVVTTVSPNMMQLVVPQSGSYTLALHSVDGRELFKKELLLQRGLQNIPWTGASFAKQVIISTLTDVNGAQVIKRCMIQ